MNTFGPNASLKTPPYFLFCTNTRGESKRVYDRERERQSQSRQRIAVVKQKTHVETCVSLPTAARERERDITNQTPKKTDTRIARAQEHTERSSENTEKQNPHSDTRRKQNTHRKYGYSAKNIGPPTKSSISPSTIGALSLDGLSPYVCKICVTQSEIMSWSFKSFTSSGSATSSSSSPGGFATALSAEDEDEEESRFQFVLIILLLSPHALLLLVLHTRDDDDGLFLCVANTALRAEDAVVVCANIIIQKREREMK